MHSQVNSYKLNFILKLITYSVFKHTLSHYIGCDYASLFCGKGKGKNLKLAKANEQFLSAFSDLGASEVVCEATVNKLDLFTCQLFGDQTARTVNEARDNRLFTPK